MQKKKVKIFIVDDHPLMREGIKNILIKNSTYTVIGEAENGEEALNGINKLRPDIVFMDIGMPNMNGLEAAKRITKEFPETKIIMLSMHSEQHHVMDALKAGAMGYVLKGSDSSEVLESVEKIMDNKRYISPAIEDQVFNNLVKVAQKEQVTEPFDSLTSREKEILKLLALGVKNEDIANKLFISSHTVKSHRTNIMKKLDIHDLSGLTRIALQKELIET
ncbi:MAG: response regulator transcription factor [Deltaproteobacteria bacterium]|nr:response regulator transcription factor [Deltaproteobacteria bacterium]